MMDAVIIDAIASKISTEDIIDQMIEECGELIQACVKLKRAYKGTTPVTVNDARVDLVEEMADVAVAHNVMMFGVLTAKERLKVGHVERRKLERWIDRIEKAGGA